MYETLGQVLTSQSAIYSVCFYTRVFKPLNPSRAAPASLDDARERERRTKENARVAEKKKHSAPWVVA